MGYPILTLDGGGIRGVFTARLLERLDEICPGFLNEFALVSGTSTGGILALGIAHGLTPSRLVRLYKDEGAKIFSRPWHRPVTTLGGLTGPKYTNDGLRFALSAVFGQTKLGDLGRKVLIPSFDLDNYDGSDGQAINGPRTSKPKFFTNYAGSGDAGLRVIDVAMATAAAPLFFPAHMGYVDGGVVANNPTLCAVREAVKNGLKIEGARVLSLGTGRCPAHLEGRDNSGAVGWLGDITSMWLDGVSDVHHTIAETFLGPHLCRVNGALSKDIPLDDVGQIDMLIAAANAVDLSVPASWLRTHL